MLMIAPVKYLHDIHHKWVRAVVDNYKPGATAVAVFSWDDKLHELVALRDRTEELTYAVEGMAKGFGATDLSVVEVVRHGYEWHREFEMPCVGAQFAATFKIVMV